MKKNEVLKVNSAPNGFKDQLINAAIIGAFNFFGTLAGIGTAGIMIQPLQCVVAGSVSFGLSFFGSLMIQRGLKAKK